ncbi:hypothetical protein [Cupriavidus campinensis]
MRRLLDQENSELCAVLEALLAEDTQITVREVARRHPSLKNASAFTRSPSRMTLIAQAQQRQRDARCVVGAPLREKSVRLSEALSKRSEEVQELRIQVRQLVAGHVALIRAVQLAGGSIGLERFWKDYKSVADDLRKLGAIPEKGQVHDWSRPLKRRPKLPA